MEVMVGKGHKGTWEFFFKILFIYLREREREKVSGRDKERESEADCALIAEPDTWLNCEIMT